MEINTLPTYVPRQLRSELLAQPGNGGALPGFIVNAPELSSQSSSLSAALADLRAKNGFSGSPCFVVPPKETSSIFALKNELDLLRSVAGLIANQVHPHLKTGIDAVWLVYRSFHLREEWMQPNRNTAACLFKLAGIGLGVVGLAGRAYPEMKLSDPWSNGLNFVVKAGGTLVEGKTLPMNEFVFSTEKRFDIPLKILKVAGVSLDPTPTLTGQVPLPLPRALVSPISPHQSGRTTGAVLPNS